MKFFSTLVLVIAWVSTASAQTPAERGEYLTGLLSCGYCHTPGGMMGNPDPDRRLAGSAIGIAYTPYSDPDRPAIVFPGNLTSDEETGLGGWSDRQIARVISTGLDPEGRQHLPIMPWVGYGTLKAEDVDAIVAYLRTLPAVRSEVPENVPEGSVSQYGWIRIGIYRFDPSGVVEEKGVLDLR